MAHQRTRSIGDPVKEPHPISLKVLRLSRPTLATQHPLPTPTTALSSCISPVASLAYPVSDTTSNPFIITPLLTLPPAFGNAYVGETFSCTLCANNELQPAAQLSPTTGPLSDSSSTIMPNKSITNVRIEAEMKTPTTTIPLDVSSYKDEASAPIDISDPSTHLQLSQQGADLLPGKSLQGIITFHLREEGSHVLAVTVSYNETGATSGRLRTFRKLYQFVSRSCLIVRTKISNFNSKESSDQPTRWALEAQLENVGDDKIVLESVELETKDWCIAISLNWDSIVDTSVESKAAEKPVLDHGDVQQVCFLVSRKMEEEKSEMELDVAGRLIMGILNIAWRGAMGNIGSLSTGWLGVKP